MAEATGEFTDRGESRRAQIVARVAGAMLALAGAGVVAAEAGASPESTTDNRALIQRTEREIAAEAIQMEQMVDNKDPDAKKVSLAGQGADRITVSLKTGSTNEGKPKYDQVIAFIFKGEKMPYILIRRMGAPSRKYTDKLSSGETQDLLLRDLGKPHSYKLNSYEGGKYRLNPNSSATTAAAFETGFLDFSSAIDSFLEIAGSGDPPS